MDWKAYVRRRLPPLAVGAEREIEIVEELAAQLEAVCEAAVRAGATELDALAAAECEVEDWFRLAETLDHIEAADDAAADDADRQAPDCADDTDGRAATGAGRTGGAVADAGCANSRVKGGVRSALRTLPPAAGSAWRSLRRAPAVSAVAILTLAIGLGTTTSVFAVARAWLFRALPYDAAHELVLVWATNLEVGQPRDVMSGPTFLDLQRGTTTIEGMAAFAYADLSVRGRDGAELVSRLNVTPEFFDVLRLQPAAGRTFERADALLGSDEAIMLGHTFWQTRLGGDPSVIGRALPELGLPRVIGVLPQDLGLLSPPDVVALLSPEALARESRTFYYYWVIARIGDGVGVEAAEQELDRLMRALSVDVPSMRGWEVSLDRLDSLAAEPVRPAMLTLLAAVVLVLLIAWANVANLMLTHNLERQHDTSVRIALGATRARVLAHVVAEAVLVAAIAWVLGVAMAAAVVDVLGSFLPSAAAIAGSAATLPLPLPTLDELAVAVAAALASGAAATLGLLCSIQHRATVTTSWSTERAAVSTPGSRRRRAALVTGQTAFTTVLLVVAGLLLHAVVRLMAVDPGFKEEGVVTMIVGRVHDLDAEARARYYAEVLRRVTTTPGVVSAALNDYVLMTNEDDYEGFSIEGRPTVPGQSPREEWRRISAGYFGTMGTPIVRGRGFREEDDERSPSVVIVNRAMARKYWPDEDPLGRRIRVHAREYGWSTIVGIVGDVREVGLDRPVKPMFFVPYHRAPRPVMGLFVRGVESHDRLAPAVRRAVTAVDPTRPISDVNSLERIVSNSYAVKRTLLWIAGGLSLLGALLTAAGVYSVTRLVATQRTREIAVRMALGAPSRTVGWLILRQGLWPSVLGLSMGLVLALGVTRLVASELNDVSPADPITYLGVALAVMSTSVVASFLPARRASRLDPVSALRAD